MHIILTTHTFFPHSGGGTEVYALALARGLQANGHQVSIVTCLSNTAGPSAKIVVKIGEWQGIPVYYLSFDVRKTPNPILYDYANPIIHNFLTKFYSELGADLVHVCHPGNLSTAVITAAKSLNIPVIMTATDFWLICPTSQLLRHDRTLCPGPIDPTHCLVCTIHQRETAQRYRPLVDRIPIRFLGTGMQISQWSGFNQTRFARMVQALTDRANNILQTIQSVDKIISPSRFLRDQLVANGVSTEQVKVSAHGIAPNWPKRTLDNKVSTPLQFAFIGQISWHKGTHVAIQALIQLGKTNDATLKLYGSFNEESPYSREIKSLLDSPSISYEGTFPHHQIWDILAETDVLLMPSMWYENTPTIMYEAFAAKTPVIATDEGGMKELIKDFAGGWTFPLGNVQALADLMQKFFDEPTRLEKAQTAIRPVRTIDEHVQDVLQIYDQVRPAKR